MSHVRLDDTDRRILRILQENARTPYSRLAKMLGVSEATIHIRVRRLFQEGVLKGFRAVVDPERVGRGVIAFILVKADPKLYRETLRILKDMDEIYELYDVTGEYSCLAKVRVGSREELAGLLDRIGEIDGVLSTYTLYVLKIVKEKVTIDV